MVGPATKLNLSQRPWPASRMRGRLLAALLLLGVWAGALSGASAQPFNNPQPANLYGQMSGYEQELYGHTYPNDGASARMIRLENTLFGGRQAGSTDQRLFRLSQHMAARNQAEFATDQLPLIAYLEDKLFRQTFDQMPIPARLERLESHVFGKSFSEYPMDIRMKKLTYAMPLVAKEIRLTNTDGMVVASTARKTQPVKSRSVDERPEEVTMLDATQDVRLTSTVPVPSTRPAVNTGDYFLSIHRRSDGRTLRWADLPMKVYTRTDEAATRDLTQAAIQIWQRSFAIQAVNNPLQADVIVDWNNSQRPIGPYTQPIMNMDDQHRVRTIILVNMTPFSPLNATQKQHAILHQLGHAAGLWGHSSNPQDVMYPALGLEQNDIPRSLSSRTLPSTAATINLPQQPAPTSRDINTLLKLYDLPGLDLKSYTPY